MTCEGGAKDDGSGAARVEKGCEKEEEGPVAGYLNPEPRNSASDNTRATARKHLSGLGARWKGVTEAEPGEDGVVVVVDVEFDSPRREGNDDDAPACENPGDN